MNYVGLSCFDTANGPGVRVSLFVAGCSLHCEGCFNPESWDFKAGRPYTMDTQATILKALEEPFIAGLSILGGDPLEPSNVQVVCELCRVVRQKFGNTKTIWLWTGRKYEHVERLSIMELLDVVVDGPYVDKLKDESEGALRGSTNQRIIYLKKEN